MKKLNKMIIIFLLFGSIYFVIESTWKGQTTDWRMFVLGGFIGLMIGLINNVFTYESDILLQSLVGMILITLCEAVLGYQWNTIEKLHIWDYSSLPLNGVNGNVSAIFSLFVWIPLSLIAILVDDGFRYYVLKESDEQPYYVLFGRTLFRLPKRYDYEEVVE